MPQRDVGALLYDIVEACRLVVFYAEGMTEERYRGDVRSRDAIERRLSIIGEAMTKLRQSDPAIAVGLGPVERIVGFRNVLVHGYFAVDHGRVWQIVQDEVPPLLKNAERALKEIPLPPLPEPEA